MSKEAFDAHEAECLYKNRIKKDVANICARLLYEELKKVDVLYLTVIINKKLMNKDTYCAIFNVPEYKIKYLGYEALQNGLICKDIAATFFDLPIDELESKLNSFELEVNSK